MIRHLVLLGVGPGHWRFLQGLLKRRPADIAITLVTRQEHYISRADLLKAVARRLPMSDSGQSLEPLLRKVNVNWLDHSAQAIDTDAKMLRLDDGRDLRFDWLSAEPEPLQDRTQIEIWLPGARANGLFTRPQEAFCKLWPQVAQLATQRPLRIAIVGGGESQPVWGQEKFAIELAFAVRQAFAGSAVTLITGGQALAASASKALQSRLLRAFKRRGITVLADGAKAIASGEVTLASGARLACDVPLLALAPQASPFSEFETSDGNAKAMTTRLQALMAGKPLGPPGDLRRGDAARQLQRIQCGDGRAILVWRDWAF
jgi:NADH dehydrogenase FAD-containing subunit